VSRLRKGEVYGRHRPIPGESAAEAEARADEREAKRKARLCRRAGSGAVRIYGCAECGRRVESASDLRPVLRKLKCRRCGQKKFFVASETRVAV
jgi:DNA-directed RNA polymerase subunit RPC12/RpoP